MGLISLLGSAAAAGGSIISNIMTNLNNKEINAANIEHEREMLNVQNQFNAEQAELADKRTRALYNDLQSPEAIKQQLQDAGLSVGLMYGQGGMGGHMQSGAQTSSAGATNFGRFAANPILDAQTASIIANAEKTAAETENIKENTKKTQVDAANAWKDLDVKSKQLIVMENQINEIQQNITESQQKVENMIAEKANILQQNNNLKAAEELTKAQKDYQESLKKLTDIQIEWEPAKQQAALENIKAQTKQYNAATKKLLAEAKLTEEQTNLLKKQSASLITNLALDVAMKAYEYGEIQPEELKKIKAEINFINQNATSKEIENYMNNIEADFYGYHGVFGKGQLNGFMKTVIKELWPF